MYQNLSLRNKITIVFALQLILISLSIFYFNKINKEEEKSKISKILFQGVEKRVEEKLSAILESAKITAINNQNIISKNFDILKNPKERDLYFLNALKLSPYLISTSFTTPEGYEYGANRGKDKSFGVFDLNNDTNLTLNYYLIDKNLNRVLYKSRKNYDPTLKIWYKKAIKEAKFLWSSIYTSKIKKSLILTGVKSIIKNRELKGVSSASIALKDIDNYLKSIKQANITIIERNGFVVSSNSKEKKYKIYNGKMKRVHISDLNSKSRDIYQYLIKNSKKLETIKEFNFNIEIGLKKYYIFIHSFKFDNMNWLIIYDFPQKEIDNNLVNYYNLYIAIISILILSFSYILYELIKFSNAISKLKKLAKEYSKGDFQKRANITEKDDICQLSLTINSMANEIENVINDLEYELEDKNLELQKLNKKLTDMLSYDALTKLYNRNKFFDILDFELKRNNREKTPLTLLLCEIDDYREINEIYGYNQSDDILEMVAKTLQKSIQRATDILSRFGEDSFTLILPNTDLQGSLKVANRLQKNIKDLKIENLEGVPMTISIGIVTTIPTKNLGITQFIKDATEALYEAKKEGKNKIAYKII